MSVTLLSPFGNGFKVTFDDGSVTLAIQSLSNYWLINSNSSNAISITELGNQLQINYSDGNIQIATQSVSGQWITGMGVTVAPPTPPAPPKPPTPDWRWPIDMNGVHVTSEFGWRVNPVPPPAEEFHQGIDISRAGIEGISIHPAHQGVVTFNGFSTARGYYVELTMDGDDSVVGVGHMLSKPNLPIGKRLHTTDTIGKVGGSGLETGPHFYMTTRNKPGDQMINPKSFMKARGVPYPNAS